MSIKKEAEQEISCIIHQYNRITKLPNYSYHFIDTPEIDVRSQNIGRKILKEKSLNNLPKFDENVVAFITTKVSIYGGGTRMIEDWINIYKSYGKRLVIIITSRSECDDVAINDCNGRGVEIFYVEEGDCYSRIKSMQEILIELRPNISFLCAFAMDITVLSAIQESLVNKLYLNLILDHGCSTGLHIPYITKIITYRPYLAYYIKKYVKIDESKIIYIPLSKDDKACNKVNSRECMKDGRIITASSTSYQYKISDSYKYRYIDVVIKILEITKGQHIHIGAISQYQINYIQNSLKSLNLDASSFIVVSHVPCLAEYLVSKHVDILIQTFPSGGGITCIEAMQAGIKIISHIHSYSYLYNAVDMLYPECFFWKEPGELYSHIKGLKKNDIITEGIASRKYFNDHLNIKQFFTKDDVNGKDVDYSKVEEQFSYSLDYFSYLKELAEFSTTTIVKKSRTIKKVRLIEKHIIRPLFHAILSKTTRKKLKKLF